MIGGQGRLFGRAVTSFIAFLTSTWRWVVAQSAALILAKSLTIASRLPLWRNNKDASVRVHQIDLGCVAADLRLFRFPPGPDIGPDARPVRGSPQGMAIAVWSCERVGQRGCRTIRLPQ
jgi:hypothetical protein